MDEYGGYMLSFNGARITCCSTGEIVYDRALPPSVIRPVFETVRSYPDVDIVTYAGPEILSGIRPNQYTEKEAAINRMTVRLVDDFPAALTFPVNKMLVPGDPATLDVLMEHLKKQYHGLLNIYKSEPYFLEIMPQNIDKAYSLRKLLDTLRLNADQMICCGDGFNDLSTIEYAGLGVAMANAQPVVKEAADFITYSNDEDGVAQAVEKFVLELS